MLLARLIILAGSIILGELDLVRVKLNREEESCRFSP